LSLFPYIVTLPESMMSPGTVVAHQVHRLLFEQNGHFPTTSQFVKISFSYNFSHINIVLPKLIDVINNTGNLFFSPKM